MFSAAPATWQEEDIPTAAPDARAITENGFTFTGKYRRKPFGRIKNVHPPSKLVQMYATEV